MTIEAVFKTIGQWSVWWLLVPALWVVGSVLLRPIREALDYHFWLRRMRRDVQRLERDRNAWLGMGRIDAAAWLEWQRSNLWELLVTSPPGGRVLEGEIDAYNRRRQGLADADYLARDQKSLEVIKTALADKSVVDELVNKKVHFDWQAQ